MRRKKENTTVAPSDFFLLPMIKFAKCLKITTLELLYRVHLLIRYGHDIAYQKNKSYRKWTDTPYSSSIHKTVFTTSVVTLLAALLLQVIFPAFNPFDANNALAGSNSTTWTTTTDFTNNDVTTDTATTVSAAVKTTGDSLELNSEIQYFSGAEKVAAGEYHTIVIRTDGTLWAWGNNGNGQLGLGDTTQRNFPVQVGTDTAWASIAAGNAHTIAIKTDGTLWAWGYNNNGQLGLGDTTQRTSPVQVGIDTNWTTVSAGTNHTLATKTDGTLWAWGYNGNGQLGLGDFTQRTSPVQVGVGTTWASVAGGYYHTLATKTDGTLWVWGSSTYGQLGLDSTSDRNAPVQVGTDTTWTSFAGGRAHTLAVKTDGTLWVCGANSYGQISIDSVRQVFVFSQPVRAILSNTLGVVRSIAIGPYHAFAIKTDGTLWSWGSNSNGQLGLGDTTNRTPPVRVGTDAAWASIAAGYYHTLAIKTDGTLWAWGLNNNGQLGLGDTTQRTSPVQVGTGTTWTSVVAGNSHTLAIKTDGTLWAWGENSNGQLGLGDTTRRTSPVQVGTGTTWTSVVAGNSHTFAIKTDGTLWAWGENSYSRLGLGDTAQRNTPVQVGTDTTWAKVSVGTYHTLAIKIDGTLWAWGYNGFGQLGLGDTTQRNTPVQVATDTTWASVVAGYGHTLAIKTDGTLWAWGENSYGQLGLGDTTRRTSPVQVGIDTNWTTVSAGYSHTLAIKTDGTLFAWGNNGLGQLGLGDVTQRTSPVQLINYYTPQRFYSSPGTISNLQISASSKVSWSTVSWNLAEALPANTAVKFRTRSADTIANLASATWSTYLTSSGSSLTSAANNCLEIELTLETSDGLDTPTLTDFTITYDNLETPNNSDLVLTKTAGTALKLDTGVTATGGTAGAWVNETTVRLTANNLTCTGCTTTPTNLRPEVEIKAIGTAFDGTGTFTATAGNSYVDLTGLANNTSYHLRARAVDDQGRASAWVVYGANEESAADLSIEQTLPTGTVVVNSDATYATSTAATLTLSASDTGSSNLSQMRFSNDASTWSDWETYATTKSWTLATGDGGKTVYAQFRDNAGNVADKKTITLRAAGTYAEGTTSVTVSQPAGTSAGDVLVAYIMDKATTGTTDGPTGWTRVAAVSGTNGRYQAYTAVVGQGGLGASPWTFSGLTTASAGVTIAYYNVDVSTSLDVASSSRYNASGGGTAGITTVSNSDLLLLSHVSLANNYSWSAMSLASGPTLTERLDSGITYDIAIWDGTQTTAGATGAASGTGAGGSSSAAILLALRSAAAATDTITLDTQVPADVVNLKAYTDSGKGTELTSGNWYPGTTPYFDWDDNVDSDLAGYKYCFSSDSGCTPTTTLSASNYTSSTLTSDGMKYFRVVAYDNATNPSTNIQTFNYGFDSNVPGRVTGLAATTTDIAKVTVTWNAYSDTGAPIESYKLERVKYLDYVNNVWNLTSDWSTGDGYATFTLDPAAVSFIDDPTAPQQSQVALETSVKYVYRIRVKDASNATFSLPQLSAVYGMTQDGKAPDDVTGVAAVACDGTETNCSNVANEGFEIKLTWSPSTDTGSGVANYNIYRSLTSLSTPASFTKIGESVSLTFYDNDAAHADPDDYLNDYTTYYYRVTAVDASENANESNLLPLLDPFSNADSVQTPDVTAPTVPTNVVATAMGLDPSSSHQRVTITWTGSSDSKARSADTGSGVREYYIYLSTTSDGTYTLAGTVAAGSELTYNDDGLDEFTDYFYKVAAADNSTNTSANSTYDTVRTASNAVPTVPTNVTVTSAKGNPATDATVGDAITVTYKGSYSKNCLNGIRCITKYELYRSTTNWSTAADWINPAKATLVSEVDVDNLFDDRDTTYTFNDSGLTDSITYYYKVRTLDNSPAVPDGGPFYSGLSLVSTGTLHAGWDTTPDVTAPTLPTAGLEVKVSDTHPNDTELRNIVTWKMLETADLPLRNGSSDFARYEIHREVVDPDTGAVLSDTNVGNETVLGDNYLIDIIPIAFADLKYKYYVVIVDNAATEFKYGNGTVINAYANTSQKAYWSESIIPSQAIPSLTTAVSVSSVGVSTAEISWTTDQDADSLVQFRAAGSSDDWVAIGQIERTLSHVVNLFGLSPNTTYEYQIVSRNYLGNNIEYDAGSLPVLATTGFTIAAGEVTTTTSTTEISWTTNLDASSAFVEYELVQEGGDEAQSGVAGVAGDELASSPRSHSVVIKGLRSNRTYTYRIKSISADGYVAISPANADASFTTKSYDSEQFVLAPSSSNVAERNITATSAQIIWQTENPTTSWVDYSTTSGTYDISVGNDTLSTTHVVLIDGLVPGTTYYYRVRVKDANEVEYTSQEYSFTAVLKPKISNMAVKSVSSYSVTIYWETNIDTGTMLNWGTTSSYGQKIGTTGTSKIHEVTIDDLLDNTEYHYQILATDETGEEVAGDDNIVRTPLDTEGPKITGVKIDVLPMGENDTTASVIISWQTNKPATTLVEYGEGVVGGTYDNQSVEDISLSTSHTVIVKELTAASSYHYRLVSADKRGNETVTQDYTFVTPTKEKSILQLILKSLEETFSWTGNVGSFFGNVWSRLGF